MRGHWKESLHKKSKNMNLRLWMRRIWNTEDPCLVQILGREKK